MPTNWNNIVGHEWAVHLLAGAIEHDRLGHAYLITGPEHVGKTTLARTFAQALNCEAAEKERPCGECRACKLIAVDRHPDVRLVEPEANKRGKLALKIETIRELQQDLNLAAYEVRYKVAIITRFDAATIGASNAFLKTLEEPPRNVVLLLTATDADTLLPTISSRCRTVGLRPLSTDAIEQALTTRHHVPDDDAYLLAHLADGRLGWAIQAAAAPSVLADRAEHLAWLHEILNGRRVTRFALADKLSRKSEQLPAILQNWLSWWRDAVILAQGTARSSVPLTNIDQQSDLERFNRVWTPEQALASLKQTNLALWQLERNANTRLVLENLLLIYPHKT